MQTELEVKAIKKRIVDTTINSSKEYGVKGNTTKGYSSEDGDDYSINGDNAKKGGSEEGSLVNHLNKGFNLENGGDNVDKIERDKQLGYVIPGQKTYSKGNYYSDADDIKIDTSKNIGQVIIY